MDKEIKNILTDLYKFDPALQQREEKLIKIIQGIIKSRPDTKFDENFRQTLKAEVMRRAEALKQQSNNIKPMFKSNFFNLASKFSYVAAGLAILALLVVPALDYFTGSNFVSPSVRLSLGDEVLSLGKEAFGSLALNINQPAPLITRGEEGFGGGSSVKESASTLAADSARPQSGGGAEFGSFMPASYSLVFAYQGEDFALPKNLPVYKRVPPANLGRQISGLLSGADLGLININKFKNLDTQNFSLLEDRDFGYAIYFDLVNAMVSISENWLRWDYPQNRCQDQDCFDSYRLKESDMLSDEELIFLADNFLAEYGIDKSNYGQPVVEDSWRRYYETTANKADYWLPETMQVIYPWQFGGLNVYENNGLASGLSVNVNIRQKRVAGLWNLTAPSFQSSQYELTSDKEQVMNIARRGGLYDYYAYDTANTVTAELGTPKVGYLRHWRYQNNQSEEFFVPALIFPVTKLPPDGYYYAPAVVVPLVKEFLDSGDGGVIPGPIPLPAIAPTIIDGPVSLPAGDSQ